MTPLNISRVTEGSGLTSKLNPSNGLEYNPWSTNINPNWASVSFIPLLPSQRNFELADGTVMGSHGSVILRVHVALLKITYVFEVFDNSDYQLVFGWDLLNSTLRT